MKDAGKDPEYRQLTLWDYPQMRIAEQGADAEVYESRRTSENNRTSAEQRLLEKIAGDENLELAKKKVKANRGAGGIDGMTVNELEEYFKENKEKLKQLLLTGNYAPQPVKRVEIPKEQKGKVRLLGIPTVVDRVIQQAIMQVLMPMYEPQFTEHSYGFRPGKSAAQAVSKCQEYMNTGYIYVVDMDLEKFFDTVNQDKMVQLLSRTIKDGRVISLIHKYMRAGIITKSGYEESQWGISQGGPLSPLLSNIMLNELDQELERRGHRYVRYADDCMIMCRSQKSAERTKKSISSYIETKLYLKVNREKTTTAECTQVKYLGFGFYRTKKEIRIRVHPESKKKMKAKVQKLTKRNGSMSHEERAEKLNAFIRGWVNYYGLGEMKSLARVTDGWLRRRIRALLWKQWKYPETRKRELEKAGLMSQTARKLAYTRKGYWRTARNPHIGRALGNEYIRKLGYLTFSEQFEKICISRGTAVCGPACTVV